MNEDKKQTNNIEIPKIVVASDGSLILSSELAAYEASLQANKK